MLKKNMHCRSLTVINLEEEVVAVAALKARDGEEADNISAKIQ
jgi:hypothetical protein